MPMERRSPRASKKPFTPSTASTLSSPSVVAGSSRSTLPALRSRWRLGGSASTSTFRPTDNAVFGLNPAPTPPCCRPAMARCSWSASPQNPSLPNVSNRKVCRPSATIRSAFVRIVVSNLELARACARSVDDRPSARRLAGRDGTPRRQDTSTRPLNTVARQKTTLVLVIMPSPIMVCVVSRLIPRERLEVLDHIGLLLSGEAEGEQAIVMIDDIPQGRGAPIMEVRRVLPQRTQGRGAVLMVLQPGRPDRIGADLGGI